MRSLIATVVVFTIFANAGAQTLAEYLKLRGSFGITQPVGIQALETLIGARVVEIKGTVKGALRVGDNVSLMLQRTDGGTLVVEATSVPEWLEGNEVPARLLVRAERSSERSEVRARLLGAAPESAISDLEAKARRAAPSRSKSPRTFPTPSRGSSGSPLRGPIGRGGAKASTRPAREWVLAASEATPYYAAFIKRRNRRLSDREATRIAQGVIGFSLKYGVDARLIMAMVFTESGFNPFATSRVGAQGLGQLMPGTARGMGVTNAYDSIDNLYGTVRLVRGHLAKYKKATGDDYRSLVLALAAYNAGGGAVQKHGGVPPYRETRAYIKKVVGLYYKLCGY